MLRKRAFEWGGVDGSHAFAPLGSTAPCTHFHAHRLATTPTTTPSQAKAFAKWFAHGSVGGFRAFHAEGDNTLNNMVVTMLDRAFKKAHHMATNPGEYE